MELKLENQKTIYMPYKVLIVPYGIETTLDSYYTGEVYGVNCTLWN